MFPFFIRDNHSPNISASVYCNDDDDNGGGLSEWYSAKIAHEDSKIDFPATISRSSIIT